MVPQHHSHHLYQGKRVQVDEIKMGAHNHVIVAPQHQRHHLYQRKRVQVDGRKMGAQNDVIGAPQHQNHHLYQSKKVQVHERKIGQVPNLHERTLLPYCSADLLIVKQPYNFFSTSFCTIA